MALSDDLANENPTHLSPWAPLPIQITTPALEKQDREATSGTTITISNEREEARLA